MSFYLKLFVVAIIGSLLSFFVFLELSAFAFAPEMEHEYPIGSFEVQAFFDQHWHSL
ncbi:hypothetical protein VCE7224_03708 [Vibrio celticus]|uniref:Uncharacterized protein n=1 Tax=Vibrio celticus TaxID=446372 RepID=A0A1C3JIE8_9VIBR|nr:hypothetical protein VCE7224_03708 [Vibrio celticus]